MKRSYRRAGTNRSASLWLPSLTGAGLIGCLVYGLLVLVPASEPTEEARRPLADAQRTVRPPDAPVSVAARVAGATDASTETEAEAEDETGARGAAPDSVAAAPSADPCQAAMAAALGNARIEFRSGSADILPASRNVISVLAALAHACPGRLSIAGHSDDLGPEDVNLDLSEQRAAAVAEAFIAFGIDPDRLVARGYGSSRPVADNASADGRARNRRIEMTLLERESNQREGTGHVDDAN